MCVCVQQNPDIVLVHYLNVPSLEDSGKCSPLLCAVSDRHDSVRWSRDDLLSQLKPMCKSSSSVFLCVFVCLVVCDTSFLSLSPQYEVFARNGRF